uniref:Uncharacterized protein n=1 Tax=Arundo donax TaxID=35708 RepID=A0A0A9HC76_ARUDO
MTASSCSNSFDGSITSKASKMLSLQGRIVPL